MIFINIYKVDLMSDNKWFYKTKLKKLVYIFNNKN